jgi:hypothetical protein
MAENFEAFFRFAERKILYTPLARTPIGVSGNFSLNFTFLAVLATIPLIYMKSFPR